MEIFCSGLTEANERDAVSTSRMKEVEDGGEKLGISKILMMENAGSAIASFIFQNLSQLNLVPSERTKILLVGGLGNNGGDVFVAARHLAYWKDSFDTTVALIGAESDLKSESAKTNFKVLKLVLSVTVTVIDSAEKISVFENELNKTQVIVAGIFGTGFRGEPRGVQKQVIDLINLNSEATKISVDVPSGLEADTGRETTVVLSDYTITMHAPKIGMYKDGFRRPSCGRILVANIGVPK